MLPYDANQSLVEHLHWRLQDIKSMWALYQEAGYLPQTGVFACALKEIEELQTMLNESCSFIRDRYEKNLNTWRGYARWYNQAWPRNLLWIEPGCDLRNDLWFRVLAYADLLSSLVQHITSRLGSFAACEATHGSTIPVHRFAGIQAIHDAAETVMYDYAESLHPAGGQKTYNGLVLFGYQSRSSAYRCGAITFPIYAETEYGFLTMLAHEAGHIVQCRSDLEEFRNGTMINQIGNPNFLPLLGEVSIEFTDKFRPINAMKRRLAGEMLCDLYATCVAGPAYPRILVRYFLPIMCDVINTTKYWYRTNEEDLRLAFVIPSLKARVATEVALNLGYISSEEYNHIFNHIQKMELFSIDVANAAFHNKLPDDPLLVEALRPYGINRPLRVILEQIRQEIEEVARKVVRLTHNFCSQVIKLPYLPMPQDKTGRDALVETIEQVSNFLSGEPDFIEVLKVFKRYPLLRPRHLISLLVPQFGQEEIKTDLNIYAILLALANHPNILGRYQSIQ